LFVVMSCYLCLAVSCKDCCGERSLSVLESRKKVGSQKIKRFKHFL